MPADPTCVPVTDAADIALARIAGARLADQAGFGTLAKHCVVTSISELASNIVVHAHTGQVELRIVADPRGQRGLEITARDQGQGIADVARAIQDHFSTAGRLGCGLSAVHRLMSEVEIESGPGQGTVVRAVKWIDDNHLRKPYPEEQE